MKASIVEINYASIKVVKKNGFRRKATLILYELHRNKR